MINKKIATKLLFMFFIASLFSIKLESKMFLGSVVFPVEVHPSLCLYYKGQKLLLDAYNDQEYKKISFSVDESPRVQEINILICQEPACFAQNNNIKHLTVCFPAAYKLYALQGTRYFNDKGEEVLSWTVVEKELGENVVPNNTLTFVFDPNLVEDLQVISWKKEDQMRILPNIVMKKNVEKEVFVQAMNIARLSAMDLDSYHEKAGLKSMQSSQAVAKLLNKVR